MIFAYSRTVTRKKGGIIDGQGKSYEIIEFFTIRKSDAFLSDYLTDLKIHSTK